MVTVNAMVEIPAAALNAVVDNARQRAGKDEKGSCEVDTHAEPGKIIGVFFEERDFLSYARDIANYG
jgi:hypothetical protein